MTAAILAQLHRVTPRITGNIIMASLHREFHFLLAAHFDPDNRWVVLAQLIPVEELIVPTATTSAPHRSSCKSVRLRLALFTSSSGLF